MNSDLSMKTARAARRAINKKKQAVWRCGWGTHDGRGCQETLGTVESFDDGETSYLRIELIEGYDRRPKGHPEEGTYFFSFRPGNRTNHSRYIKEGYKQLIHAEQSTLQYINAQQERLTNLDLEVPDSIQRKRDQIEDEKEGRGHWRWNLVAPPSPPSSGPPSFEEDFLPATIRCKKCRHLSTIGITGSLP